MSLAVYYSPLRRTGLLSKRLAGLIEQQIAGMGSWYIPDAQVGEEMEEALVYPEGAFDDEDDDAEQVEVDIVEMLRSGGVSIEPNEAFGGHAAFDLFFTGVLTDQMVRPPKRDDLKTGILKNKL